MSSDTIRYVDNVHISIFVYNVIYATVAQLVEQCSCKAPVGGSSPLGGSIISSGG